MSPIGNIFRPDKKSMARIIFRPDKKSIMGIIFRPDMMSIINQIDKKAIIIGI
tara:strand:+ start:327 stop:485 length:159 start_codon:yes stop_codon:yes gene_type:complete